MAALKIGFASYEEFKERTLAMARGEWKPEPDDPTVWFTSVDGLVSALSRSDHSLLDLLVEAEADTK